MFDAAHAPRYAPSTEQWVRDEVEHYERTGSTVDGRRVVLLTSLGARSGLLRKTPLMRVENRGTYAVIASQAGAATHPSWYHNLLAEPRVLLQDGPVRMQLRAREVSGQERARWWSTACVAFPSYADYQSRTRRQIPVLVLEPEPGQ